MGQQRHVAVLTNSAALGSIITMILERTKNVRAQAFSSAQALDAHMRIIPVDVVVSDFNLDWTTAPELILSFRREIAYRQFHTLVLTNEISRRIRQSCNFAKIDEVLIKPLSPALLASRVEHWLGLSKTTSLAFEAVPHAYETDEVAPQSLPDNVIAFQPASNNLVGLRPVSG